MTLFGYKLLLDRKTIEAFVFLICIPWCGWKFYRERKLRYLWTMILPLSYVLPEWHLEFPYKFLFALASFMAASFLFYDQVYLKKFKAALPLAYIYIALFVIFGFLFLSEGFAQRAAQRSNNHRVIDQ